MGAEGVRGALCWPRLPGPGAAGINPEPGEAPGPAGAALAQGRARGTHWSLELAAGRVSTLYSLSTSCCCGERPGHQRAAPAPAGSPGSGGGAGSPAVP